MKLHCATERRKYEHLKAECIVLEEIIHKLPSLWVMYEKPLINFLRHVLHIKALFNWLQSINFILIKLKEVFVGAKMNRYYCSTNPAFKFSSCINTKPPQVGYMDTYLH